MNNARLALGEPVASDELRGHLVFYLFAFDDSDAAESAEQRSHALTTLIVAMSRRAAAAISESSLDALCHSEFRSEN